MSNLLESVTLGELKLKNRILMAPSLEAGLPGASPTT